MSVVQSRGRGRTGLGEVQGKARSGSGLRARTGVVDQGSAAVEVGSVGGGGTGSGLLCTRRHRKVRARTGASSDGAQCRRLCRPRMLGAEGAVNGME